MAILPGKSIISPYTIENAGEFLNNAVVIESIQLPKVVKTYNDSIYDFEHTNPGSSVYCYDLSKIGILGTSFNIKNLPLGLI